MLSTESKGIRATISVIYPAFETFSKVSVWLFSFATLRQWGSLTHSISETKITEYIERRRKLNRERFIFCGYVLQSPVNRGFALSGASENIETVFH